MKRFLTIILSVLIICAVIFFVHSCKKNDEQNPTPSDPVNPSSGLVGYDATDEGKSEDKTPEKETETKKPETEKPTYPGTPSDNSPVYTGVGIYHGRTDSARVEITLDTELQPILISSTLTPELAENFSSLNLEEDTIISFEYQIINDQYVISKIIK